MVDTGSLLQANAALDRSDLEPVRRLGLQALEGVRGQPTQLSGMFKKKPNRSLIKVYKPQVARFCLKHAMSSHKQHPSLHPCVQLECRNLVTCSQGWISTRLSSNSMDITTTTLYS